MVRDELEHKDVWAGTYRGVYYEIVHWGKAYMCDGHGMWNYYVYINQEMLSPEEFEQCWLPVESWFELSSGRKSPAYNEYDSKLNHGDFYGGITHYSKHQCPDEKYRHVKIGCDYGHLWDMEAGYPYDEHSILGDVKRSIDKLHEVFRFKVRCHYNGTWDYPENMTLCENGEYISESGKKSKKEWDSKQQLKGER